MRVCCVKREGVVTEGDRWGRGFLHPGVAVAVECLPRPRSALDLVPAAPALRRKRTQRSRSTLVPRPGSRLLTSSALTALLSMTCPHDYCWHLEKSATQMPAISWRLTSSHSSALRSSITCRSGLLGLPGGILARRGWGCCVGLGAAAALVPSRCSRGRLLPHTTPAPVSMHSQSRGGR